MLYDHAPPQREYENDGLKCVAAVGRPVILLEQVKPKTDCRAGRSNW
jgi:putative restriction endonuclease